MRRPFIHRLGPVYQWKNDWRQIHAAVKAVWFAALVLLAGLSLPALSSAEWSKTRPEINLTHIFSGEINAKGKAVGFHSRPRGIDPPGAKIKTIQAGPNGVGVYTARVFIHDQVTDQWKEKFSTLFPDAMSRQQVIDAILHAWHHKKIVKTKSWKGPSGKGFVIQGYLNKRGNITTAFPLYTSN